MTEHATPAGTEPADAPTALPLRKRCSPGSLTGRPTLLHPPGWCGVDVVMMYPYHVMAWHQRGAGRIVAERQLDAIDAWCCRIMGNAPGRWLTTLEYDHRIPWPSEWIISIRTCRREDHALVLLTWS